MLFPHSLGIFYQAMTQYLGFPHYGDEYKLMGLAAYGDASLPATRSQKLLSLRKRRHASRLDLKYFRHHSEDIAYEWHGGEPVCGPLFSPALVDALGPPRDPDAPIEDRHRNLALATQAVYEDAFFHLLNTLQRRYRPHRSRARRRLRLQFGRQRQDPRPHRVSTHCYLQSAAGDAGGAIGAAYAVWHRNGARTAPMTPRLLGPVIHRCRDRRAACRVGTPRSTAEGCSLRRIDDEKELVETTARAIADGLVVGWFQGRMEWGPRALGNRSILGDPRRADMKTILNLKIKRRESFRPFAPSILREAVADWFERDDDVPFMLQVIPDPPRSGARRYRRSRMSTAPGGCRPSIAPVILATMPCIEAFSRLTGVPMVLNTSFNENEPVVCRPEEALDCFLRTKMDVLVLGNYLVRREAVQTSSDAMAVN